METTVLIVEYRLKYLGSYPTYEEWKQYMRSNTYIINQTFLSYLWGMETTAKLNTLISIPRSYPTYEE